LEQVGGSGKFLPVALCGLEQLVHHIFLLFRALGGQGDTPFHACPVIRHTHQHTSADTG